MYIREALVALTCSAGPTAQMPRTRETTTAFLFLSLSQNTKKQRNWFYNISVLLYKPSSLKPSRFSLFLPSAMPRNPESPISLPSTRRMFLDEPPNQSRQTLYSTHFSAKTQLVCRKVDANRLKAIDKVAFPRISASYDHVPKQGKG